MVTINLNNFENYIEKKILARGYDYYENNYVTSVEETEENVFEAEVEGTELYTVGIELDDQANIIDTECDCPYDMGNYCKHQVAAFLAVRDIKNNLSKGIDQISQNSMASESILKVSKKRKAPNVEKILSDRTKDELIEFLLDIASEYEEIKRRIELIYDDGDDEAELSKAMALIRTYINNNSDRHGYVAQVDTGEAVRGADLVLEKAHFALEQNKAVHALQLSLCVIQEMMDLLQDADDSDGVIGQVIEESLAFIDEMSGNVELKLQPIHKETMFNKLIEEASHQRYVGWTDWRIDLLESCSELADTSDLRGKLENYLSIMLENAKGDSWGVNYLAERVNLIRYHQVEKHDGQKKAQEFIENNLQYSDFREMAIKSAMNKKDYDYVIKLTLDGEDKDKSLRGLVNQWKKYRYEAFKLSEKIDDQRGMATDFILDGSFDYYTELKNTYATNEWTSVYPKIIFLLENQKKTYLDVYPRILIEEGEKRKLFEFVQGSPLSVEIYYRHLIPEFKEEVYLLFQENIEQSAARAGNRKDYQRVCAIIRNLKTAGGEERASEIKEKLYNKYANRPAFRDELSKV